MGPEELDEDFKWRAVGECLERARNFRDCRKIYMEFLGDFGEKRGGPWTFGININRLEGLSWIVLLGGLGGSGRKSAKKKGKKLERRKVLFQFCTS